MRELILENVHFTQSDSLKGSSLDAWIPFGQVYVNEMDLPQKKLNIRAVNFREPVVAINNWIGTGLLPVIEKTATDTTTFSLAIGEILLTDGRFQLDNFRKSPERVWPDDQLDLKHLDLSEIQVEIDSLSLAEKVWSGRVNWIAAKDASGFHLKRLSANEAEVSDKKLMFNGLSIITPTSSLGDTLVFRYKSFEDWAYFTDKVKMDVRFHDADVTLQDIIAFVPNLNNNRFFADNRLTNLQIDGRVKGNINNLRGDDLNIQLADGTRLEGKFTSQNLAVKQEEFLMLDLRRLSTRMGTLRQLIPRFNPPKNFDKLGRIDFRGSFIGFFVDFVADGTLVTDLGQANMDMQMVLKQGAERAKYAGNLALRDFDIGKWTGNPDFGKVDCSSSVKNGFGLTADLASADLTADVERFTFRDYTYRNAVVTGQLNKSFFGGDFVIHDDNIDFTFKGEVDFRDTVPLFDFEADIRKLDMLPLNLSKQDMALSGKIDLNLSSIRFADMQGDVSIKDLQLTKDKDECFDVGNIKAFSFYDITGEKVFRLDSEIAKGEIRGAFDINELPATFKQFALKNYPELARRLKIKPAKKEPNINHFYFDFHIADSKGINYLIDPKLQHLKDFDLMGRYNGTYDSLQIILETPSFTYGKVQLEDVYFILDLEKSEGDLDFVINSTYLNGKKRLDRFTFLSTLASDSMRFGMNISTDSPGVFDKLNLGGSLAMIDSTGYNLRFKNSNLNLANLPWSINQDNQIKIHPGALEIDNFYLTNRQYGIQLLNNGSRGLRLQFVNFDFGIIDEVWDYAQLNFSGNFDMLLQIDDVFAMKGINMNINAEEFFINKDPFGIFRLDAYLPDLATDANAILRIGKDSMQLEAEAVYNLADIGTKGFLRNRRPIEKTKDYLGLGIKVSSFPIDIITYWLQSGLSSTTGRFDADLSINGLTSNLDIGGYLDLRNGGFTIDPLQTHYTFDNCTLQASKDFFDLTGTVLYDKYGNTAIMEGGITHNRIKNLGMNARLRTRRFLGMDLKPGDNELFYGRALGEGEVLFTGDFQRPNIYVNATVQDSTFIVIPVTDQVETRDLDFVRFVNKHQQSQKTNSSVNTKVLGLNLEMDIHVTEVADLELIFDEKAGDILRGQGRGDLRILMPRAESFQMYGSVAVTQGNYLFTLKDIFNKDFVIRPGGTITWSGDPLRAIIDIDAEYKDLRTPLTSFMPEYLLTASDAERNLAQQPTDVDLILELQGDLFKPDITFDLAFPNLRGQLQNLADNKLQLLRRDPNEMNRQVFGLIVLGQFLPADLSFSGNGAITNTLSEYFSNQLSLLVTELLGELIGDGKTLSSLNFEVVYNRINTADVTSQDPLTQGDALEISLKSGFLNERLSVDLGGNFAFGEATQSGTFFGEEIIVEYAISPNRDIKIRFYERLDQDLGGGRRRQVGTGLNWRKEYNSFHEFWDSLKKN
ncbi:MAG: translocation/assembly module TamB domain-containing protein [Saprospiraceae bacterium]